MKIKVEQKNKDMEKGKKCMFPDCDGALSKGGARGLCRAHYWLMSEVVKKGTHSWEEFEEVGYCLKSQRIKDPERVKHFYEVVSKLK